MRCRWYFFVQNVVASVGGDVLFSGAAMELALWALHRDNTALVIYTERDLPQPHGYTLYWRQNRETRRARDLRCVG